MRIRRKSFVGIMTAAMLLLFTACSAAGNATQNAEPAAQAAGAGETAVEPAAQATEQQAEAAQPTDEAAQSASAQVASAAAAEDQQPAEKNGDIMILYTSDIHCGVDQGFGLVGLKQVRDTLETRGYTTILVDDGN